MLISSQTSNSILYDTLAELGLLCTEEYHIKMARERAEGSGFFEDLYLSHEDICGVSYLYPHFTTKPAYEGKLEVWIGGRYVNPLNITWIRDDYNLYGVIDFEPEEDAQVRIMYNPQILYRYTKVNESETYKKINVEIDIRDDRYSIIDRPDHCAYCIIDNKIIQPATMWLDDFRVQYTIEYTTNVDFVLCSNLLGVFAAQKKKGVYIDNPMSTVCYHNIVVDNDPSYKIDARFYPCIAVNKDCMVRVYNDHFHRVPHPESTRLINYPEYAEVADPYDGSVEYFRALKSVNDMILKSDSDATIQRKFLRISRFAYRAWEAFPKFTDEVSDFVVCDNNVFGRECFKVGMIFGVEEAIFAIYSTIPFEDHRDLLFYKGELFSDYTVMKIATTMDNKLVESEQTGVPTYVIPLDEYDVNGFTLVKFNAWEDTQVMNIGEYVNENLTATLYTKLNRFFRNMMVIRSEILNMPEEEYVRVMSSQPTQKDEHMWFELLTNVNPEEFKKNIPMVIDLFGLDSGVIPKKIREGAYKLDIDPEDGPVEYTSLMLTYYQLSAADKDYLALQSLDSGDPNTDPHTAEYKQIQLGSAEDAPSGMVIDTGESGAAIAGSLEFGTEDPGDDHEVNDLYMQGLTPEEIAAAADTESLEALIGQNVTVEEVSTFSRDVKIAFIHKYFDLVKDSMTEDEIAQVNEGLLSSAESQVDEAVYQILKTEYIKQYAQENQLSEIPSDVEDADLAVTQNMRFILSPEEPTEANLNDIWIEMDGFDYSKYIANIISYNFVENPVTNIKKPVSTPTESTFALDFGASGDSAFEIFQAVTDPTLRKVSVGMEPPMDPSDLDIWYEYLDDVRDKVAYFDEDTMILRVNERLMAIKFSGPSMRAFMFDDIVMNFRGKLGIKYLSILADLINSKVLKESDCEVFYKRLVTIKDVFELGLRRLYTDTSHVVVTADVDTTDLSVIFSTNIGRFSIDYADTEHVDNDVRAAAYRMCVYYKPFENFAFLPDRMLLFLNGKLIPADHIREEGAYMIRVENFDEVISTADILYSAKDEGLMLMKRSAMANWPIKDTSTSITRPERDYGAMDPMYITQKTKRGYYDVLINEYILNGRLARAVKYLSEHPEEIEDFKRDFVQRFHAISDLDLGMTIPQDHPRIIISGESTNPIYTVGGYENE